MERPRLQQSPLLLAVDDDPAALERIERELGRRYAGDYRVVCLSARPRRACAELERTARRRRGRSRSSSPPSGRPGTTGSELLARARQLHPHAKRGLLIEWGAWGDRATARRGAARRWRSATSTTTCSSPGGRPTSSSTARSASSSTSGRARCRRVSREVEVVGERWSPRSHELRSLLARNGVPHAFHASDSPAGPAAAGGGRARSASTAPVAIMLDGQVLVDPSNAELAAAFGVSTDAARGRARLRRGRRRRRSGGAGARRSTAPRRGSTTLVVERESIGGQAGSSSLIRNYLGFSRGVSGAELAQRAYQQAWVFGTDFLLMRDATSLRARRRPASRSRSPTAARSRPRAVVLAMGVSYRRLDVPSLDALVGAGVFYGAVDLRGAGARAAGSAYVVGGGNSAGQAAMHLSRFAERGDDRDPRRRAARRRCRTT